MAKPTEPGEIVRYEEAERPLHAAVAIAILTLLELVFVVLIVLSVVMNLKSAEDQIRQAQWFFAVFFILGFILMIYRWYYMPDVMVVKVRNKKYEDFIDRHRIPRDAK